MNRWFANFILFVILLNCVSLSLGSNKPEDKEKLLLKIINISDYVFLGIFTLEMVLKIIAMGLVMRPYSYLRDPWNIVSSFLRLTLNSSTASSSSSDGFPSSSPNQEFLLSESFEFCAHCARLTRFQACRVWSRRFLNQFLLWPTFSLCSYSLF